MSNDLMTEEQKMWHCMNFCNGEIRVMAGRYGGGWLAAGCAITEWDFDDKWSDLCGGDSDYIASCDFFYGSDDIILIEHAASPLDAFNECVKKLIKTVSDAGVKVNSS